MPTGENHFFLNGDQKIFDLLDKCIIIPYFLNIIKKNTYE